MSETTATTDHGHPSPPWLSASVRQAVAAGAGVVLPFSFAPFGQHWLAPLCFAGLIFVWRGARPREALFAGFLFGAGSFGVAIYWIYISVSVFSPAPAWLGVVLTAGLVAIMSVYCGVAGWAAARWFGSHGWRLCLLAAPALWVLLEWLRGWFLTGFGWLAAGYSQADSWLAGYTPVFGVFGTSFAVVLLGGAVVCAALGRQRERLAGIAVAVAVIGVAYLLHDHRWTRPKPEDLTVALVQGGVTQDRKWLVEQLPITMDLYRSLTETVHGADLIVWPEAAIPQLYENMGAYLGEIERSAATAGSTLMLGMLRLDPADPQNQHNAVFALGRPDLVYVKRHLVPYGEYYPLPEFAYGWLRSMNLPIPTTVPGDPEQPLFDIVNERIAITICYEDVFGAEQLYAIPEATLLVNVSNDAWFGESIESAQHLQISRARAAEVGRYLLHSTNTGITAVIDPLGNVIDQIPQFQAGTLTATVRGHEGATPYALWGNIAILLLCVVCLAFGGAALVGLQRSRQDR